MTMGMTFATTELDRERWSLSDMYKLVQRLSTNDNPPHAFRLSRETLLKITNPNVPPQRVTAFWGIPIELDDSLQLFEVVPVN